MAFIPIVHARMPPMAPTGNGQFSPESAMHSTICYHQMPGWRRWVKMHCSGINEYCFVATNCTKCNDPNYNGKSGFMDYFKKMKTSNSCIENKILFFFQYLTCAAASTTTNSWCTVSSTRVPSHAPVKAICAMTQFRWDILGWLQFCLDSSLWYWQWIGLWANDIELMRL